MKNFTKCLFIVVFLISCSKEDQVCLPGCIVAEIGRIAEAPCDDTANITRYRFQGSSVYVLDPGYCADDQSYDVINSSCEIIGRLGGFVGNTKINGIAFYENAELLAVVWKK